jgi:hypothetical protein
MHKPMRVASEDTGSLEVEGGDCDVPPCLGLEKRMCLNEIYSLSMV